MSIKTFSAKAEAVERRWYIIDAENQVLGRLACQIAGILKGKHKPIYTPHVDTGDFVVVINAHKVRVTGRKAEQKRYYRHSGYPGGLEALPFQRLLDTAPERIIEHAVQGMMPKKPLGRAMLRKLKVYAGGEHPHEAQQPVPFTSQETSEV